MDNLASQVGTPRAGGEAVPGATAAAAGEADAAALKAECERLTRELNEAKRKFVVVAKKKQQEYVARWAVCCAARCALQVVR